MRNTDSWSSRPATTCREVWTVRLHSGLTDKLYERTRGSPTGIDYLSVRKVPSPITLNFVPAPRQKISSADVDLAKLKPCSLSARGSRLHGKPVRRVTLARNDPAPEPKQSASPTRKRTGKGAAGPKATRTAAKKKGRG